MKKNFSKKKLLAIELLARCEYKHLREVWEEVGVGERTLHTWRKDPLFAEAVISRSRDILKETLPDVYDVLSTTSKKGSHQHIKILLEHLERLEEMKMKAQEGTFTFTWKKPVDEQG